jgi:hypothetical protein
VLGAIRKGQVRVESRPMTLRECAGIFREMVVADYRQRARSLGFRAFAVRERTSRISEDSRV